MPVVMGILNATPDSFSDGGVHLAPRRRPEDGAAHGCAKAQHILDIGGESTRPGSEPVGVQEELDRVLPVLDAIAAAELDALVSIDTRHALVADQALQSGAHILNDVEGLQGEPELAEIAAAYEAPVIAMHWDRHRDTAQDVIAEMKRFFDRRSTSPPRPAYGRDRLILDPGFGFAKTLAENYEILRPSRLNSACSACRSLSGTSRKSMIGHLLDVPPDQRLAGTIATSVLAYERGAHIFRVHDVRPNRDALRVAEACLYGPPETEANA